jgi:hypothetical protein
MTFNQKSAFALLSVAASFAAQREFYNVSKND